MQMSKAVSSRTLMQEMERGGKRRGGAMEAGDTRAPEASAARRPHPQMTVIQNSFLGSDSLGVSRPALLFQLANKDTSGVSQPFPV